MRGTAAPKNVLIVGMARSGTSLTAGAFARVGHCVALDDSDGLLPANPDNPLGYWEAKALTEFNAAILARCGFVHHNTWTGPVIRPDQAAMIHELDPLPDHLTYVRDFEARRPWVWKDPRLCYTLGYWWPLLDPRSTVVVLVRRDPAEIYQSFRRLNWCGPSDLDRAELTQRAHDHLFAARAAIDRFRIPFLEVEYADLLRHPVECSRRMAGFAEAPLNVADLNIRPELNHSSLRARLGVLARATGASLPPGIRRALKRVFPAALLGLLFPERKYFR